jgi:hypothetical protein
MGVRSQLREATMRFLCLRGVLVRDRPLPSSVDQARDWLLYATGGFAWTYDQLTLTQLASGATDSPFLWRFGWVAGAGVEFPVMPHWTAKFEDLLTDYGVSSVTFPTSAQRSDCNFLLQEFRAGLNYQFDATSSDNGPLAALWPDSGRINFHGQTTFVEQAYPSFRSPYVGTNSLPGTGQGRETWDATLYTGVRTIRSGSPASSTAFPTTSRRFSTPEVWASSLAMDSCRILPSSRFLRPITATR